MAAPLITLLTDFGDRDYFVGSVKGVILDISPDARIVDLSHNVAPQDVEEAAFILKAAYRYFPPKTIHVVVVDPGVGSARKPIVVTNDRGRFVAPNNGVLTHILDEDPMSKVYHVTASHYFLESPGATFHGRDVFAPIAAWLSTGVPVENMGPLLEDFERFPLRHSSVGADGVLSGEVIYVDRFGNLITNITLEDIVRLTETLGTFDGLEIHCGSIGLGSPVGFYSEAGPGKPSALVNSSGFLEVFVYLENARKRLGAGKGFPVTVRWAGVKDGG